MLKTLESFQYYPMKCIWKALWKPLPGWSLNFQLTRDNNYIIISKCIRSKTDTFKSSLLEYCHKTFFPILTLATFCTESVDYSKSKFFSRIVTANKNYFVNYIMPACSEATCILKCYNVFVSQLVLSVKKILFWHWKEWQTTEIVNSLLHAVWHAANHSKVMNRSKFTITFSIRW